MLTFDDLLAARIVMRDQASLGLVVLSGLEALRVGEGRGLLLGLTAAGKLSLEQAVAVQQEVQRYRQRRLLVLFAGLAVQAGIPQEVVGRVASALGEPRTGIQSYAAALVRAGHLAPEHADALRFQSRLALDRDLAGHVSRFLDAQGEPCPAEVAAPNLGKTVVLEPEPATADADVNALPDVGSGVFRLSAGELAQLAAPETLALTPPAFEVPDWVDTSEPSIGKTVAGYRILGRIGAGTMGSVYLADHPDQPERPVALKTLHGDASAETRGRFERAILATSLISDDGVIDVYDAGQTEDGSPFLAMEFFDGEHLGQVLESEEVLDPARALRLARQLFASLETVHAAAVVHRDIKPENILVSCDGDTVKLTDFGIATVNEMGEFGKRLFKTATDELLGTPRYMSPEQASCEPVIGHAADLYSLGLVLFEMLSGDVPFESESSWGYVSCHMFEPPRSLVEVAPTTAALPKELHELLRDLLAKAPMDRPPSAAAVVEVLDRVLVKLESRRGTGRWLLGLFGRRRA